MMARIRERRPGSLDDRELSQRISLPYAFPLPLDAFTHNGKAMAMEREVTHDR